MPPAGDIQRQLLGAWRMMTGKRDGIRLLDLSLDGFWNSFFAIVVALPVLLMNWVPMANEAYGPDSTLGQRLFYMLRIAVVDVGAWVLPIAALAAVAGYVGIRDRFVQYVVSSNWGGAIFAWLMLPASLLQLIMPDAEEPFVLLSLCIFIASLVLSWRLTNAAIDKGAAIATGIFTGMLVASIATLFALQDIFGLVPQ